ncbi:MAG: hypothetical protein A2015_01785 [Spirochaetes bacterium GWF1_31_7]|nr:MAG: hypothetical protein A2Y30_00735 [Spirochaetes bacterium GWE1_32_154]OHD45938.1 MAG: hypothetical protein A2Y29_16580 [Spirochaetes bacterium GWE2_31_10]OHD48103.1 MAG: hypothetical protein A2015_01785 [Spirochaetes bacterium GWF1_31_7]OHD80422.1 MAG: hypothetical protein A2355_13145 [Spirochaetes bacterium RIFOXYB1_FULL_32_8]HBD95805.1 hypothetical protein [Spirochaetia bacterium]
MFQKVSILFIMMISISCTTKFIEPENFREKAMTTNEMLSFSLNGTAATITETAIDITLP